MNAEHSTARKELRNFLRSRRARISPRQYGLAVRARRRSSGLRKEDVAELADISPGWYSRFESGVGAHVSSRTLSSIGRVLRLDADEMAHLSGLAGVCQAAPHGVPDSLARESVGRLVESFAGGPAFSMDRCYNVLASNAFAQTTFGIVGGRHNLLRALFLDPAASATFLDWRETASRFVAQVRARYSATIGDPALEALLHELREGSEDFNSAWAMNEVRSAFGMLVRVRGADSAILTLRNTTFVVPDSSEDVLALWTVVGRIAPRARDDRPLVKSAHNDH